MCRAIWDRNCVLAQKQLQARPKGEQTDDQKSTKKSLQKWIRTQRNIDTTPGQISAQKFNQIGPNIGPKSIQHLPKIDEKSSQNRLRRRLGPRSRFWTDFGSILAPTWGRLGGQDGVMLGPCWPKNWFLEDPEGIQNRPRFPTPFGTLLGLILERFWGPKSNQNRSKIGLKSDHEANAKILKIIGRGCVFEDPRAWTSIKIRSKSCLKTICVKRPKQQPENDQKNC